MLPLLFLSGGFLKLKQHIGWEMFLKNSTQRTAAHGSCRTRAPFPT